MKNYYSISIPKPCHENWDTMTPKEKGRFCDSCAKTVIDFTKMNTLEIQNFIHKNKQNRICGHFKQTQLDSINLNIPSHVLIQQHSFHKLFLLALLITMGLSLFSCTNKNGAKQKIDSIEVIDSIDSKTIDILGNLPNIIEDSAQNKTCTASSEKTTAIEILTDGELNIETVGDIEVIEPTGIITYEEEDTIVGFIQAEFPPEFKNTPKNLSKEEKQKYLSNKISEIVTKNFNESVCLGLKGKQKIFTQFKIDEEGHVIDIKARAPHPKLEEEAKRVLKLLPQFIPAKQRKTPIAVVYNLPIIFQIEE